MGFYFHSPTNRTAVIEKALPRLRRVQEVGLRYYKPEIGRWVSRDPIGEWGGLNIRVYSHNDPIGKTDSLGLGWEDWREVVTDMNVRNGLLAMLQDSVWMLFFKYEWGVDWRNIEESVAVTEVEDGDCCLGTALKCSVTKTKELHGHGRLYAGNFLLPESASTLERDLATQLFVGSRQHELVHGQLVRDYVLGVGQVEHTEEFSDCWSVAIACAVAEAIVDVWFDEELTRHRMALEGLGRAWDAEDRPRQVRFREWIKRQLQGQDRR